MRDTAIEDKWWICHYKSWFNTKLSQLPPLYIFACGITAQYEFAGLCLFMHFLKFIVEWILAIRGNVHRSSSVQTITRISVIVDKKIKCSLFIWGTVHHLSLLFKFRSSFSLVLFSAGIHKMREKIVGAKQLNLY